MNSNELLKYIEILENKKEHLQKMKTNNKKQKNVKGEKVKDFRKQVEYGEKKFIKP